MNNLKFTFFTSILLTLNCLPLFKQIFMIKLVSRDNPDILAFKVKNEVDQEDVDWLVERIGQKYSKTQNSVSVYVEFENFEEITLSSSWKYLKMLLEYTFKLIKKVDKLAAITSSKALRKKLSAEFFLIPNVQCKTFQESECDQAVEWLENI